MYECIRNKNAEVSSNNQSAIDQMIYFKISIWIGICERHLVHPVKNQSLHLITHIFDKCIAHVHTETREK
jgi:hypothetical protein